MIQEAIRTAACCKFFELNPVKLRLPHFCATDELQGSNAQAHVYAVEQVCISKMPRGEYRYSAFTI